jgi:hypothetical protein
MSQLKINHAQPANPTTGQIYFDDNLGILKLWTGTGWVAISHTEDAESDWVWHRTGLVLRATSHHHENFTEHYMKTIQDWCTETSCGTRTSFDTWSFKSESEITAFLLTWA